MGRSVLIATGVGALNVHVVGAGTDSEPAVLLWHSMLVDHTQWRRIVPALSARRRLILVDGPGHGLSSRPPKGYTLEDCAAAASAVLAELGEDSVDWVGNAWGGHVGLVFASRYPRQCRSIVSIAAPISPLTTGERIQVRILAGSYRLLGPRGFVGQGVADALVAKGSRKGDPEARRVVRAGFARAGRVGMHRSMHAQMLSRPDIGALLPSIAAPALLIAGDGDPLWSPQANEQAARRLPRGASASIAGAHRLPPLERPDDVIAHLEQFWARTAAGAGAGTGHSTS